MPQLIHTLDSHVDLVHDGVTLFSYVYNSRARAIESPRPYFHPLRTLKGNVVSGFRPHDHRWHHGLSMTCANLSGHNFWGGPTFTEGEYQQLDNNGRQISNFLQPGILLLEDLEEQENLFMNLIHWKSLKEKLICVERRVTRFHVDETHRCWSLNFHIKIDRNPDFLIWGSPTTQGRENAGYGGLFWRGPRDFIGGEIMMSDNRAGADLMGQSSPWLAYSGQHDETDDYSTLIFVDNSENPRHPTPWFVRNTTPMVCPYFAFHEEYTQEPREILNLNYRIIIADGKWERDQIEAVV